MKNWIRIQAKGTVHTFSYIEDLKIGQASPDVSEISNTFWAHFKKLAVGGTCLLAEGNLFCIEA